VLVEIGQSTESVGQLTAVRQFANNVGVLIQGPLGGFLATGSLLAVCGVNGAFLFAVVPVTYFILKEEPVESNRNLSFSNAKSQIATIWKSPTFWWALVFITFFYCAPGFTTLLYYRQTNVLKLDPPHIGYLQSLGGFGGILGAVTYGFIARKLSLRSLLTLGIITSCLATYMYLKYEEYRGAMVIDFSNGLFFGFAEVAFIDLAARATPSGCEGLGYSLMLSFRNMALFGADYLGSLLSGAYKLPWSTMVIVNGTTTGVVILMLPFIPKAVLRSKDRESSLL
jgi:predicted MFS family arabinose efflux permease